MFTMCTSVHMSIHSVMTVNVRSMCMPWFVCMHRRNLFLSKHRFQTCMVQNTLVKVEPKQLTLFFKIFILFLILEDKVEHAIGKLECEAVLAWQTCESILFFKEIFFLETKSNSFEIEIIYFSKIHFLLQQNQVLKIELHFSSKQFHNHFYFSKNFIFF